MTPKQKISRRTFTKSGSPEKYTKTNVSYTPLSKPHTKVTCKSEKVDAPSTMLGYNCLKSKRKSKYIGRKSSRRK